MKKKLLFGLLIGVLIALPLFAAACEEEEPPPAQQEEEEEQPPAEEEEEEEGDWWDKLGEPQYGGTITFCSTRWVTNFDTFMLPGGDRELWLETLFGWDWALDREIWDFRGGYVPDNYWAGRLAETWEQTDPTTITVHLRQGVHWQDIEPVNGREFTAYDVQAHYDRMLGIGDYTEPAPMYVRNTANWESVTATEKYTVVFKFKEASAFAFQGIADNMTLNAFEPPEVAAIAPPGGNTDPKYAIGTGPWILEEYAEGTSLTFSKNPNYWGYDERHPENQLPYADTLKMLIIPEITTQIAALRSGQVDILSTADGVLTWQQMETLAESNPELEYGEIEAGAQCVIPRFDAAPVFTDIRVRKALQLAINIEELAQTYYGGTARGVACGFAPTSQTGYCYAYEDWPQELKDEYSYNPTLAMELLAEAAADGVFEPNELGGFDTSVIIDPGKYDSEMMEIFKAIFLEIGVDMEIIPVDAATFESLTTAGTFERNFQMSSGIAGGGSAPPQMTITSFDSRDARNQSGVNDPTYDAIVDSFLAAASPDEAMELRREADRYIVEQHWIIVTCPSVKYNFWQPYLKGYIGEAVHWGQGFLWARLWIDQALK